MPTNFADGQVHELTQGSLEFNTILDSAVSSNHLVLLDFSASWCGPCRMLAPFLKTLAEENLGRLIVVKMDCESTPENAALAREADITAFPTLHIYRQRQRTVVLRGADPRALGQAVQKELSLLSSGEMTKAVAKELGTIRANCTQEEFTAAAKTLLTFVSNILNQPNDAKYRRIKLSNTTFQSKLGSKTGGKECMLALGFTEKEEDGEAVLYMETIDPELPIVKTKLEQAMGINSSSQQTFQQQQVPSTTAAQSSGGASTGNVDAAALAAALAQALRASTGVGGQSGTAAALQQQQARRAAGPRQIAVTPKMLARYLEKILLDAGFGSSSTPSQ